MRQSVLVFVVVLFVLGVSVVAFAQQAATVDIPFPFIAGTTEMPAGRYQIKQSDPAANNLSIRRMDNNNTIQVPVLTRISDRGETTAQVVFDKTEDKNYLSEVYIPGIDGFHLQGAPGKHTHRKIPQSAK